MPDAITPAPGTLEDLELDHEQFAGPEIKDPWDDEDQSDWTQNPVDLTTEEN